MFASIVNTWYNKMGIPQQVVYHKSTVLYIWKLKPFVRGRKGLIFMDIPTLSVAMSQANIVNQYNIAVLAKTLDTVEESGAMMIKMMEQSVNPHLGQNIDITV